jgi:rare lipoprotein A
LAVAACVVAGCGSTPEPASPRAAGTREPEPAAVPAHGGTAAVASPGPASSDETVELVSRYEGAAALAEFSGKASYYSDALAGRPTASGEPYDPQAHTAAHKTLPFRTVVRVVHEDNQRVVYVRINDRGPFVRGRVLDLSKAAARDLGLLRQGVAKVRVEVVEYGPAKKKAKRR